MMALPHFLAGITIFTLFSVTLAQTGPGEIAAPNQVEPKTCKGSGENRKCKYCAKVGNPIYSITKCWWVKAPEKPKKSDSGSSSIAGSSPPPKARKEACRGGGKSFECRYCVDAEGARSCQWIKFPQRETSPKDRRTPVHGKVKSPDS